MKITLLNQVFYPDTVATAQHLTDLALFLTQQGCEVTVVTGRRGYENRSIIFPSYEVYKGVKIYRVNSTGFGKKSFWGRIVDAVTFDGLLMTRFLTLPKQDLVIAFTSPPLIGVLATIGCLIRRSRLVQWLMDINPEAAIAVGYLKPQAAVTRTLLGLFRWTLKRSEKIVVLDRWMKERVMKHGVESSRICIVPPWPISSAPLPASESDPLQNPIRQKYGIENKFVVLYSGNHSIVHPLTTLLQAANRLKDREDVAFVFAGSGLRVVDVTEYVAKHDLKNVFQIPPQPRDLLSSLLSMANLHVVVMGDAVSGLVHTSKIYGVVATGKPYITIAPRDSHLADMINRCPGGFLVEHGDVQGVINAIARARAFSPAKQAEYAERNSRYVDEEFGIQRALQHFAEEVLNLKTLPASQASRAVGT